MNSLDFRKRAIMSSNVGDQKIYVNKEGNGRVSYTNHDSEYSLKSIKLFGYTNEVGEGEKSPSNPYTFEHMTNPTLTIRGGNLIDNANMCSPNTYADPPVVSRYSVTETGFICTGSCYTPAYVYDLTNIVKPNTTYYFHRDIVLETTDGESYTVSSTPGNISGFIKINIDGSTYAHLYSWGTSYSSQTLKFTTPESFTSCKIETYGTTWLGEHISDYDETKTYCMEWRNVWLGTEPYTEYEPYYEPQTITLSDTVLRGIQCKPGRAEKVVDAVSDTGYGYKDADNNYYVADSIIVEDDKVILRRCTCEAKAIRLAYNGAVIKTTDTHIKHTSVLKTDIKNWHNIKTYITMGGINYGIHGSRVNCFKTWLHLRYAYIPSNFTGYGFNLGSIPGEYTEQNFHILPLDVATDAATAETYLNNLFATQDVIYILPETLVDTDITNTELGQLLLRIHTYPGTTVIESDGFMKATFYQPNEQYVYDGLIFSLDGKSNTSSGHSNEVTTWYDWVSKTNKTIRNYGYEVDGVSQIYWEDDGLYCIGNGSGTSVAMNTGLGSLSSACKTIEWVGSIEYGINTSQNLNTFFGQGGVSVYPILSWYNGINSETAIGIRFNYKNSSGTNTSKRVAIYGDEEWRRAKHHYAVTLDVDENNVATVKVYMDGVLKGIMTITDGDENISVYRADGCLGMGYDKTTAKYYSFKMYNRVLTDDEINNNYKIDTKRYLEERR